jgi:hypothetical protein
LPGSEGVGGEWEEGQEGEMVQTMYTHRNKCIRNLKIKINMIKYKKNI